MSADLPYYIHEGVLVGLINGQMFHLEALSGGGEAARERRPQML